jgi:cobalt/nickel transport system permease protein
MHITNQIDLRVAAASAVVGAAGLAYGLRTLEKRLGERTTVLMGTMAAFVFAAQMVTFPLGLFSGHLIGGVLAAVMLGPWAGAVVIAAVLIVQCFLFGDGGLPALGANFVNMGLIGSVGGYAIYAPVRRAVGGRAGVIFGAMVAAWFSVLLSAGAFAFELLASGRRADFFRVLSLIGLVHAAIGVGEAVITGLVLRLILLTRPDLVYEPETDGLTMTPADRARGWVQVAAAGLAVSLAIGVFLAPFASDRPDGLEFVAERLQLMKGEAPAPLPVPMPDYAFPGLSLRAATAAAGAAGTLVVFGFGGLLSAVVARAGRRPKGVAPDAA